MDDDVLYRTLKEPKGSSTVETRQIVVPTPYRRQVMALAHESLVGGHLAMKKTLDRITSNFHWPGISGDVTRYCRSCDVCQKIVPRGRATKVPLGEMPLMDEPF